jgi:hypothetical protein
VFGQELLIIVAAFPAILARKMIIDAAIMIVIAAWMIMIAG